MQVREDEEGPLAFLAKQLGVGPAPAASAGAASLVRSVVLRLPAARWRGPRPCRAATLRVARLRVRRYNAGARSPIPRVGAFRRMGSCSHVLNGYNLFSHGFVVKGCDGLAVCSEAGRDRESQSKASREWR